MENKRINKEVSFSEFFGERIVEVDEEVEDGTTSTLCNYSVLVINIHLTVMQEDRDVDAVRQILSGELPLPIPLHPPRGDHKYEWSSKNNSGRTPLVSW